MNKFEYKNENQDIKIEELIVIKYYENLFESKLKFLVSFCMGGFNYLLYKIFNRFTKDQRKFIFIDNNRLIYNKLCDANKIIGSITKYNSFFFFIASSLFLFSHLVILYNKPYEIFDLEIAYGRENVLYQNIYKS